MTDLNVYQEVRVTMIRGRWLVGNVWIMGSRSGERELNLASRFCNTKQFKPSSR